jgi:hypothetical protein
MNIFLTTYFVWLSFGPKVVEDLLLLTNTPDVDIRVLCNAAMTNNVLQSEKKLLVKYAHMDESCK